jgi:putative PIN family toxin of toxin-antitoxin system
MPASNVVVFDANVLITLILPASQSTRLFQRLDAAGWEVAASPQLLAEAADKLRTKATLRRWVNLSDQDIEEFLTDTLLDSVSLVPGIRQAIGAVPRDPKDDIIIAAAVEAEASFIVSEDKHLLDLKTYAGITIMNREQFAAELDRLGVPQFGSV